MVDWVLETEILVSVYSQISIDVTQRYKKFFFKIKYYIPWYHSSFQAVLDNIDEIIEFYLRMYAKIQIQETFMSAKAGVLMREVLNAVHLPSNTTPEEAIFETTVTANYQTND